MADVSVKMGVSGIQQFKQGMSDAAASVKTLDAALKTNEKQLKATGDKEAYLASQSNLLKGKIDALKTVAKNAEQALKQMEANGVSKTSKAYQDMQRRLVEAQGSILDTQQELQNLGTVAEESADKTDKLANSLGGLNKKVSLEQVRSAIGSITSGMENAAKKAAQLGKTIWEEITEKAAKADDIATKAMMYDMTTEEYQAVEKLANTWSESSVEAIMKARQRVQSRIGDIADDLMGIGVDPYKSKKRILGTDQYVGEWKDWQDIFWDAGEALMNMSDSYERAAKAEAIFGRKWEELKPMFKMGREEYTQAVKDQITADNESIQNMAKFNDTVNQLKSDFESLEMEVLGKLAPALTSGAEVLDSLLGKLMAYLETPEGKKALEDLETAVSGLFEDLSKIDPQDVVQGFTSVFNTIIDSLKWLNEHKADVVSALEFIVGGWATLKLTGGALDILKLIDGIKGLTGAGGATAGSAAAGAGLGGKLLATGAGVGMTGTAAAVGSALTMFDPTGLTALLPSVMEDQTVFLRTLRNGGSIEEAATESSKAVSQAFDGAVKAWEDWGNQIIDVPKRLAQSVWKDLFGGGNNEPTAEVKVEPKTDEEAAAMISAQIGTVSVPVKLTLHNAGGGFAGGGGGGGGGLADYWYEQEFGGFKPGFANGLPMTPFDGWYYLHRGEKVTPAREVSNRSYNSNLYVENMNMSNGMDAQALATALSAQSRRISAGYGS